MPGGGKRSARGTASPQFHGFVTQVVALARSVAPEVADMLDPEGATPAAPWSGSRERGLKLCASMLAYARAELADEAEAERIDRALAAVAAEAATSGEGDVEAEVERRR